MVDLGAVGLYSILSGLTLFGFLISIVYFFVGPVVDSLYRRHPGFLFPWNSLRLKTLWEEVRSRGYRWLLKNLVQSRKSILTYWSFLWVIPLGFIVVFSLAYLGLPMADLVQTGLIRLGWQAQLTVASLSFIVLIFLLEQISRTEYREGVVQEFFASSRIMPVIYFTLASSGLIAYLYFYHTPEEVDPLFVDATFFSFAGTVLGIGYVYYRVARLIFFDPMDEMSVEQVQRGIDLQLKEEDRQSISKNLLKDSLPDFVRTGTNRDGRVFMAQELGLDGYIADIDLKKLNEVCREYGDLFDEAEGSALVLNLDLGAELQPGVDVVAVDETNVNPVEVPRGLAEGLSEAVYCSDDRPWKSGNRLMERNLDQIGASTRKAISNLNPSGLEKYLELYTDLLQYGTTLNREVIENYGVTPPPISDLVDHIFREFYQIMEAAGETGSSDLINTVRAEIFRLSLAYHRQGENYLFEKSIGLYGSYYRILFSKPSVDYSLVSALLSSMNNILTMLTAALGRTNTVEEVERVSSDIESFYETLEDILRLSVEEGDSQTFNNVWNMGDDDFVMVRPESEIYELRRRIDELERAENWENLENRLEFLEREQDLVKGFQSRYREIQEQTELDRLKGRLEMLEMQQEKVEGFQSEFEETRFVAAAWAYREVQTGNLPESVFQVMFSESIKRYSFNKLAEVYFQILTDPLLDLFRWESEDSDVFKGVQVSQPAVFTWLQEFFCAMGLLFLDAEGYELEELDEGENPMAEIDISKPSYPDLGETIESISKEELSKTGVAESEIEELEYKKEVFLTLHNQMQEILERREEDYIIESDLDPEKVSNFKESYISGFEDRFNLREVLDDLGWLNVCEYDGEVEGFGTRISYPKGAFIPDPPAEFVHNVDQQTQNHVNSIIEHWIEQTQDNLSQIEVQSYELLPEKVEETCSRLDEKGTKPKAIVINGFRASNNLRRSDYFVEEVSEDEDVLGGFSYDDGESIPIYRGSTRAFDGLVLAGDGQSLEVSEYQRDRNTVFVDIEEVTHNLLKQEDPQGFEEMTDEEIRNRLQSVWIQIWYYSEIEASAEFGALLTVDGSN